MSVVRSARCFMAVAAAALWAAPSVSTGAPPSVIELNGFLLNQHESAVNDTFSKPWKTFHQASIRYDVHILDSHNKTYMVFGVDESTPLHHVVSLQLTGGPSAKQKHDFLGLRLGDPESKVREVLGAPDKVEVPADQVVRRLEYHDRNYSVEIDKEGRLFSIRLAGWDGLPRDPGRSTPSRENMEQFKKALASRDGEALLTLLMPDAEVYLDGETRRFTGPARDQVMDAASPIRQALLGGGLSVKTGLDNSRGEPEVALRLWAETKQMGWAVKYPPQETGPQVIEAVWKYYPGGWRIWEISVVSKPRLRKPSTSDEGAKDRPR